MISDSDLLEAIVIMTPRCILLDIEGTTSSISFVYDEMFPFVRRELERYLSEHWQDEPLAKAREQIARDAGQDSFAAWCQARQATSPSAQQEMVRAEILRLMDGDVKATGLKALQGLIWE